MDRNGFVILKVDEVFRLGKNQGPAQQIDIWRSQMLIHIYIVRFSRFGGWGEDGKGNETS